MDVVIRKLTPDLVEDYIRFFDTTPHDDLLDKHKCYCVCWCSEDCTGNYERKYLSSRKKRKKHATQCVRDGSIQGYLAYCNNEVVGWCNANTKKDCLKCYSWRRYMEYVPLGDGEKVKSIFCFTCAPEMKRKGLATLLMKRVCEDAAQDGFDFVEAYPKKEFSEFDCGGPLEMYLNSGFTVTHETAPGLVVRKRLTQQKSIETEP